MLVPGELYGHIIIQAGDDFNTLCALAQCSRQFRVEAERELYRDFNLYLDCDSQHIRLMQLLCHLSEEAPHHALYVRSFELTVFDSCGRCHDVANLEVSYIQKALMAMRNLKSLKINDTGNRLTRRLPSSVLLDQSGPGAKFHLEEFSWRSQIDDPAKFLDFVAGQTNIKRLGIDWDGAYGATKGLGWHIPTEITPDVTQITGPFSIIQKFVSSRHIKDIQFHHQRGHPLGYATPLTQEVLQGLHSVRSMGFFVRNFACSWGSHMLDVFTDLGPGLVNLEYLETDENWPKNLKQVAEPIAKLPALRRLRLKGQAASIPTQAVTIFFDHSPSLESIEIYGKQRQVKLERGSKSGEELDVLPLAGLAPMSAPMPLRLS